VMTSMAGPTTVSRVNSIIVLMHHPPRRSKTFS
jgi:hypothetical protein